MLGSQALPTLVLGLIVYILIGILCDFLKEVSTDNKEEMLMKTRTKKVVATVKSILNSVWTVGANLLAGALLT